MGFVADYTTVKTVRSDHSLSRVFASKYDMYFEPKTKENLKSNDIEGEETKIATAAGYELYAGSYTCCHPSSTTTNISSLLWCKKASNLDHLGRRALVVL